MADLASVIDNVILTLGFTVLVGSMVLPMAYKNILSLVINWLMSPLTAHAPFYVVLLAVSAIITVFSTLVLKYKIDGRMVKQLNERSASLQKKLKAAQLAGNKEKLKKLETEQTALFRDQSRLSIQQLKSTAYTALVSIPLLIWVNWYLGNHQSLMTFSLPFIGTHAYTEAFLIVPYWCILLSLFSITIGYVVRKAINQAPA